MRASVGAVARTAMLAAVVLALVAAPGEADGEADVILADNETATSDSDSTIAVSDRAGLLLVQIRQGLTAGDFDRVAYMVEQLHEMEPEVVVRETGRGVHLSFREMLYGLSPDLRQRWASFISPQAETALEKAGRLGGPADYAQVARRFPGTAAARQASERLYGLAFESGRFHRAIELIRSMLADPDVTVDQGRIAQVVLAICAGEVDDHQAVVEALERLRALKPSNKITLFGSSVDPVALVEELSNLRRVTEPLWTNVGGSFTRSRLGESKMSFERLLVIGRPGALSESAWEIGGLPTRKQLLEKQELRTSAVWTEAPVLVTDRSFIAGRGGRLVAYDRLSGDRLWQLALSPDGMTSVITSWPSAGDGKVATVASWYLSRNQQPFGIIQVRGPSYLVQASRKKLVVLSEKDGEEIWSWDGSLPVQPEPQAGAGPAAAALEPAEDPADRVGLEPAGSPLVYGGRLFVGAVHRQHREILVDSYLMCFRLTDGKLLWQRFIGSGSIVSLARGSDSSDRMVPTTDGRRLFVESSVGTLVAIDLATADLVWRREFPRPEAPSRMGLIPSSWPGGLGDAPIVAGNRLLVTDISNPELQTQLRCLDIATGRDLWKGIEIQPGQRLGVAEQMVLVSSGRTLRGYDIATGRQRLLVDLPNEARVTGRGFLSAGAAYVPTDDGIFRIDLKEPKATRVYAYDAGTGPSLALAPVGGGGVVSNHADHLRLFGRIDEYFERVRRGMAAHPDDPLWTRRLAELCRQNNDFEKAVQLLELAAEQAGKLVDPQRQRDEKLAAYRQSARLYGQWGRHLLEGGKPAEAVSKLETAVHYSTDEAAQVRTLMTLGRYYEQQGDKLRASAHYARLADREAAERLFQPADRDGLEQTLATRARLALRELSTLRQDSGPGIGRDRLDRLSLRRIGMLNWSTPSRVLVESGEPFTPLVWVRTDGLIGLGPGGEIRWRRSKPAEAGDSPAMPVLDKGLAYQSHNWGLVAYWLDDGRQAWTWEVPKGRITASGARAGRLLPRRNFQRIVDINGNRLLIRESVAGETSSSELAFTDGVTVVGTYDQAGGEPQLHGLDPASGRQKWSLELPQDMVITHLATEGGRVVVALQQRRGTIELRCVDANSGQLLWKQDSDVQRLASRELHVINGIVVLLDHANRCWVVDVESGERLWKTASGLSSWPQASAIWASREMTVLRFDDGCVAVSNRTGKAVWQIGSAPPDSARGSILIRSSLDPAAWNEAVAFGDLVITWRRGDFEQPEDLIVAYRIKDGQVLWQHETGGRSRSGYSLAVCRDMLMYHDVGEMGFRTSPGDGAEERRLMFLAPASGKLLGALALGAGPVAAMGQAQLEVYPTRGGLFVLNGNEMLSVRPSDATGAAPGGSSPSAGGGKI